MKIKNVISKKNISTSVQKYSEFIYGIHAVIELLVAKRRKIGTIYTTAEPIKAWNQIKKLLPEHVPVMHVTREKLSTMAQTTDHQGVLAFVAPFPYAKQMFHASKHPFILLLDGVQDVRNLGAIIRSAYCTGVDGIVLVKKGGASITAAAVKASAGLAEHVQIFIAPSIASAVQDLQQNGYHIYLATLGKGENAAKFSFEKPTALVIGSEESGISPSIFKNGTRILLPQRRADISYNASVAAGILLFLIGSQIQKI